MTQLWSSRILLGVYNLTPLHYGVGQATGAVDLPIARDAATQVPVLPATGIKGVLRDYVQAKLGERKTNQLFGADISEERQSGSGDPEAGRLTFTEARLIAYPARSLNRPFLHVTCPLILDRLRRDLAATGADRLLSLREITKDHPALTADKALDQKSLVLDNLVYGETEVRYREDVSAVAEALSTLLPETEATSRERLVSGLVIVPDADFGHLMRVAVPVQARVRLTGGKTTDKWLNPETGKEEKGNLWYEEYLPSDCLFVSLVGERRSRNGGTGAAGNGAREAHLSDLVAVRSEFQVVQLGGNETVGYGLSWLTTVGDERETKR
ncbi:type III-B CRISPR module RAMP protein Cmr4 [Myxococcota bacterium]